MKIRLRESTLAVFFIVPAFIFVAVFMYYPLVQTAIYSVFDLYRNVDWLTRPFIGLQNYVSVFASDEFRASFGFTLVYTVMTTAFELILALGMALATFSVHFRLRGILRAALVIPWAVPPIVSATLWRWLYNGDVGLFTWFLRDVGLVGNNPPPFLTDPTMAIFSIILTSVWMNASIMAILLLGGLAAIPKDIYEAAKVDGARSWLRFWDVTLPLLVPTILVAVLYRSLLALRMFELSYGLTGGGPGNATDTLSTFAYKYFFTFTRYGEGSAYAMTIFVLVLAVAIVYVSRMRKNLRFKE
jgi:ABC-type sugar transport system permease subunit